MTTAFVFLFHFHDHCCNHRCRFHDFGCDHLLLLCCYLLYLLLLLYSLFVFYMHHQSLNYSDYIYRHHMLNVLTLVTLRTPPLESLSTHYQYYFHFHDCGEQFSYKYLYFILSNKVRYKNVSKYIA